MRYASLLIILFGALACMAVPARAEELTPGLDMTVELGYNGYIQQGAVNPVIVNLDNNTADLNLSGDLVLEHNGVEYVTRLELATPSKKRYYLYYPADSFQRSVTVRIRTRAFSAHREFQTFQRSVAAGDANILVLDSQSGSLAILSKLPGVRMQRNLHDSHIPQLTDSETFVAYFDIDEIDFNPKFFSRADTIILGDFDYQQVTEELVNALKACISGGTNLIFSLGNNGSDVAGSRIQELCPLKVTGSMHTEDLGSFGRRYGLSASGRPATLSTGDIAVGAKVVEWADLTPVVVRKRIGCGAVTALAFDYTAVPFKQQPALAPIFIDNALSVSDSVQIQDWFIHPEMIDTELRGLGEAKPMPPWFVLLFLLCYVLLVGPANFLILGKLKRRTMVWTTIPLLIIGFSWLGLSTGYLYRGSNNVTATFQELHLYPDSDYLPYQTTTLIFTAERTHYDLKIPDQYAFLYPDVPLVIQMHNFRGGGSGMRGISGGKIDNSGKPRVSVTQGKWTSKQYSYNGYLPYAVSAKSDLQASGDRSNQPVRGSFTIDLPFDLHNCVTITPGGGTKKIGNIEGKGTYDITTLSSNLRGELPQENYLVAALDKFRGMNSAAVRPGLDYRNELLLVGFTQEVETKAEFNHPSVDHNLTMIVIHLPYEKVVPVTGDTVVSPPLLVGGANFDAQERVQYDRAGAAGDQYKLMPESYIDVSYTISGYLGNKSSMSMSMLAWDGQTKVQVSDLREYLTAEYWDGQRWNSANIVPGSTRLDIDFNEFIRDDNREVVVRFRALREIVFGLPIQVDAY